MTVAVVGLLLMMPMLLVIGLVVKVSSKGPVLYKATRIGRNEQSFKLL